MAAGSSSRLGSSGRLGERRTVGSGSSRYRDSYYSRYRDRPMDFADATLVHMAQREGLTTIFTIDNNDFETYRIDGNRLFTILPGR